MMVCDSLAYSVIDLDARVTSHVSVEMQAVVIQTECEPLLIINIYRHPSVSIPQSFFCELFAFASGFPRLLIVGDFNAHHTHWYGAHDDRAGKILARSLETFNIAILNDRNPPSSCGPQPVNHRPGFGKQPTLPAVLVRDSG